MMEPKHTEGAQVAAQQTGAPQTDNLTTEEFHKLLEENVLRAADERKRHQGELARIKNEYNDTIDNIVDGELEAQEEYREARERWEDAKDRYECRVRNLNRKRNLAGQLMNTSKMEETNRWTLNNNIIQSDRHNIFERYRNSGGQFFDNAGELLHPAWSRKQKGVSDEND